MKIIFNFIGILVLIIQFAFRGNIESRLVNKDEKFLLGKSLFYDSILSLNRDLSCGTCHLQRNSFSYIEEKRYGISKRVTIIKSVPQLFNIKSDGYYLSDGSIKTLSLQVYKPVRNPEEMNLSWKSATERVNKERRYKELFRQIYLTETIDSSQIVDALTYFVENLISNESRFDKWNRNEVKLTELEYDGYLFFCGDVANCSNCHELDIQKQIKLANNSSFQCEDRHELNDKMVNFHKTPRLVNIALTFPYMHDKRFESLEDVLLYYSSNPCSRGIASDSDPLKRRTFSDYEKKALLAFLNSLTDTIALNSPKFKKGM